MNNVSRYSIGNKSYRNVSFKQMPVYSLERLLFAIEAYHMSSIDILLKWIEGELEYISLPSDILPSDMLLYVEPL